MSSSGPLRESKSSSFASHIMIMFTLQDCESRRRPPIHGLLGERDESEEGKQLPELLQTGTVRWTRPNVGYRWTVPLCPTLRAGLQNNPRVFRFGELPNRQLLKVERTDVVVVGCDSSHLLRPFLREQFRTRTVTPNHQDALASTLHSLLITHHWDSSRCCTFSVSSLASERETTYVRASSIVANIRLPFSPLQI